MKSLTTEEQQRLQNGLVATLDEKIQREQAINVLKTIEGASLGKEAAEQLRKDLER